MFAVIFETVPNPGDIQQYLDIAAMLKPELAEIDGFLENERFRRNDKHGVLLSLSLWRDEKSLIRWRTQELHHQSQVRGRGGVLSDYRLRIGEVVTQRDCNGDSLATDPRQDLTEYSESKFVTISIDVQAEDVAALEAWREDVADAVQFSAINDPERQLLLLSWRTAQVGEQWLQTLHVGTTQRHYGVNIIRTYGMHDRAEAPVFHPPVTNRPG